MSVRIIKKGLLDTIQDNGRYGYQHLGINPGGAMDRVAAAVANMLVANHTYEPVIELHFPAASFLFESGAMIALTGADFGAIINRQPVPLNTAITVSKNALLEFSSYREGARCYFAVNGGWKAEKWLNSYSTDLKAQAGGYHGKALKKDDVIFFKKLQKISEKIPACGFLLSNISADSANLYSASAIRCVKGNAFEQLTYESKQKLTSASFVITIQSDRMGYRLQGETLTRDTNREMISSAVTKGAIQLLPSGQLIVLMADHQTTGGYPVPAHVISTDMPLLAQKPANEKISFQFVTIEDAELALLRQQTQLETLQRMISHKPK